MDLCHDLIESDRTYFERGARQVELPGAVLVHMPVFRDIPAGAAVHRIDPTAILPDPLTWVVTVETITADLGLPRSRLFLERSAPQLELALTMLGYRSRAEAGLIRSAAPVESTVELVPICSDEDWGRKLAIHPPTEDAPDGFAIDPVRWVAFERAKAAAGYFTMHLAIQDGVACGTVGIHRSGAILRFKNLVVASTHRRRGVGAAILNALTATAHADGLAAVGCFALWGEHVSFYRANGFGDAVTQVGWDRTLTVQLPARLARKQVHAYT